MRLVLNTGCHCWMQQVADYANKSFMAVFEELKAVDPGLIAKIMPGYCRRLRHARCEPDGRLHHVSVTATNSEAEPELLRRLRRVVDAIRGLPDEELVWKIKRLHDHKGNLTVTWNTPPTENNMRGMLYVWLSSVGDGSGEVSHEFNGQDARLAMA